MDKENSKKEVRNLVQEYDHFLKELSELGYKSEVARANFFRWLIAKEIGYISGVIMKEK